MKKLIALLLLVATNVFAFDSSSAFNVVTMSYTANSTITQIITLNSTQQQASSLTFSVDVKNGGGRPTQDPTTLAPGAYPTQTDSAWVTIYAYSATGALVTSITSQQYVLQNWGSDPVNHFSTKPGDNLWDWSSASVTLNTSLANIAYVKVEMKGTDGAWWAGNYGPEWRTPTLTVGSDTSNILYNPEFGVAPDGKKAQGWTSSSVNWSNCGVTSGSLICVTTESGVTANMWGGGYDANGGTTSGTAGGYTSTLSVSTADTAATSGTPTGGTGGGTSGPPPFDGTLTQTNATGTEVITSGSTSTAGITSTQQPKVDTWTNSSQSYNNILYIEQTYGSNNQVTITQSGVKNRIDFTLNGNGNVVNTTQTGSNYLKEEIPGWGNNVTINQSNTALTNYAETKIQGNGNTVNHTQTGPGNHILFSSSAGDINTVNVSQSGNAGHYAETKLTGNWNNVKVEQFGNTANKANIDVTNAGGPATVDLQQTGGRSFTIIQSCTNPAGCSTTVRQ